jgi:hypothetical protein
VLPCKYLLSNYVSSPQRIISASASFLPDKISPSAAIFQGVVYEVQSSFGLV